jgi:cob(I)alamin adenosyltransferase
MVAQLDIAPTLSPPPGCGINPGLGGSLGAPALEGMVQVFTAPYRGFCTSVVSQAMRLAGQGTPTLIVQFLKGGINQGPNNPTQMCQNFKWVRCAIERCIDTDQVEPQEREAIQEVWEYTKRQLLEGRYALVILDELSLAINYGFIPEEEVLQLLKERPSYVDVVLTGPQMPAGISSVADQWTELRTTLR